MVVAGDQRRGIRIGQAFYSLRPLANDTSVSQYSRPVTTLLAISRPLARPINTASPLIAGVEAPVNAEARHRPLNEPGDLAVGGVQADHHAVGGTHDYPPFADHRDGGNLAVNG